MSYDKGNSGRKITGAVLIGIGLLVVSGLFYSAALFMMSVLVFGCINSPPSIIYSAVILVFPVPLIIASILTGYFYFRELRPAVMTFTYLGGIALSSIIFIIWFIVMMNYC